MIRLALFALLLASAHTAQAASVQEALNAFDATLDTSHKQALHYPFEADERLNWHFVPKERNGLSFKGLNGEQTERYFDVLRAITSEEGFETLETIRSLEVVLQEIEQGSGPIRDPHLYFLTVFGTPSDTETWSLRFEGHHISLHWVFIDGKPYASTPQFLGSNPGTVQDGHMKGVRPLGPAQDLALALVNGLSDEQRTQALIEERAPRDILSGTDSAPNLPEKTGISYEKLDEAQQKQLVELIDYLARLQRPDFYSARIARVQDDLEEVTFTWMGGLADGEAHYYRIHGPSFLIEYDNIQNNANHIHTIWRDVTADFGADMLKEHYTAIPHNRSLHQKFPVSP